MILAYTCDINALHNKIDAIHEQTKSNDASLATIINEYPTVDEVNDVLKEYALKKDIPEPVDLSNYALKSDYDELKTRIENLVTENTNLKATIESFESRLASLENGLFTTQ